jgi:hypothetical protein
MARVFLSTQLLIEQGPMQCSEIVCPLLEAEKLILPPSEATPLTLMLPLEVETRTEAVADFDPAEALEELEADAVPPPLTLTWLEDDTDTLPARAC